MRSLFTRSLAFLLVIAMLSTGLVVLEIRPAAAQTTTDPLGNIVLSQGTTGQYGGGNYVAVNLTNDNNTAWFGVVYGAPGHPNSPTLVGEYIRYLGGATVRDQNGNVVCEAVPIPVLTFFAQDLQSLVEFNDTGILYSNGTRGPGAGNGLFDFVGDPFSNFSLSSSEPINKYLSLKSTNWTLGPITTTNDTVNETKDFEFTLSLTNVSYTTVWDPKDPLGRPGDPSDGNVSKVAFTFHIDASAKQMQESVPWFDVSVNGTDSAVSSNQVGSREYNGTSVSAAFDYDTSIQGWNFDHAPTNKLMLENMVIFASYVPPTVQKWLDAQYINGSIPHWGGQVQYLADNSNETSTSVPERSIGVEQNILQFKDDWQRVGALTWASNATVDGENTSVIYQVHGAEDIQNTTIGQNKTGVSGTVFIGGYIYPAGTSIIHDPGFSAGAFDMNTPSNMTIPTVVGPSPQGDEVAITSAASVTFSEPMNESSVSVRMNGVDGTASWYQNTITFTPGKALAYDTSYTINITGKDLNGTGVSYQWSFRTSDQGSISGTVVGANNDPLTNATVTLDNGMTTTTDANGHFVFYNISEGSYNVTISKSGYGPMTEKVNSTAGAQTDIATVNLASSPAASDDNGSMIVIVVIIAVALLAGFVILRRKK